MIQLFHMGGRRGSAWAIVCCFSQADGGEGDLKCSSWTSTAGTALRWGTIVAGGSSVLCTAPALGVLQSLMHCLSNGSITVRRQAEKRQRGIYNHMRFIIKLNKLHRWWLSAMCRCSEHVAGTPYFSKLGFLLLFNFL